MLDMKLFSTIYCHYSVAPDQLFSLTVSLPCLHTVFCYDFLFEEYGGRFNVPAIVSVYQGLCFFYIPFWWSGEFYLFSPLDKIYIPTLFVFVFFFLFLNRKEHVKRPHCTLIQPSSTSPKTVTITLSSYHFLPFLALISWLLQLEQP